jgi:glycosyltransferase involved in cell wall biosynthesis
LLAFRVWRRHGFDVVHICNPPDLLFLVAAPFKLIGKKVIFDHHDICPELFVSKFNKRGVMHAALGFFERLTFRLADIVIAANDTFRELAVERGGKSPADVVTVYSIPDTSHFYRVDDSLEATEELTIGYVGILGKQDGVDHLIRAVADLKCRHGLGSFRCRIVGNGPEMHALQQLAIDLSVSDVVEFTGFLTGRDLLRALSSFDIGVIPDPHDEYNDKISMNKVFEYSALGIPLVSYELSETKRLLGGACTYAEGHSVESLADAIHTLAVNDRLRQERAAAALARAKERFHWSRESAKLLAAYELALSSGKPRAADDLAAAAQ